MLKRSALLVAVLLVSSLAFAQQRKQAEAAANAERPDHHTCAFTFASGSGATFTQFCVSVNGNIPEFISPANYEFLPLTEGYGLCDLNAGGVSYFDYGPDPGFAIGWDPSTVSSTATTVTVTRVSTDGRWKLKQVITQVKATAPTAASASVGSAKVAMSLTNLTDIARDVFFLRYAYVDANSSSNSLFTYDKNTAIGKGPSFGYGLGLTTATFRYAYDAYVQPTPEPPDVCNPTNLATDPFIGNGSIVQLYALTVGAGKTAKINVIYKPI